MTKLGEALALRARQAQRLDDLRGRIRANVLTQEGTKPAEDATELLKDFDTTSHEHALLLQRIAATNQATEVEYEGTTTLAALIHRREHRRRVRNILHSAATAATPTRDRYRYSQSELKYEPQVNVGELRQRVDEMDVTTHEMDAVIQEANWKTDLI
jgi:hypothetical protein